VVPHVPVCTYTHAREGGHVFAERVKKKTGAKWDRDQAGCASEALASFRTQQWLQSALSTAPPKINARVASLGRFLGLVKDDVDARV
jgi:hypothetical protein